MSDFNENIKPAILQNNEAVTEMSAEEFQRTLLTWFEDRGIVSDLRAHLRRNMIEILKDTSLGRTVSQKQSLSPKTQIINLLIAEFLMKYKYHFSLSVFSTEVPFLSILPDYSTSFSNASIPGSSNAEKPTESNFTEQNFWDILQTLGFASDSIYSKKLHNFYFNKSNDPLLICIIRLLSLICNNKAELRNEFKDNVINVELLNSDLEPWLKDIYNLLTHFDVPDEVILQLHEHLKSVFDKEHVRIKTEESTKFNYLHTQIQKDFQNREAEICKMINEMENTFYKEKQKLSGELTLEQEKLNRLKEILVLKQREFDDKLDILNRKEESLKQRESEILEQTEILKSRIKVMQNVYDSIVDEKSRANTKEQKDNDEQTCKIQLEYEKLRREIQETRETIKKFHQTISDESINKEKDHQTECEEKLLKGLLERVQAENSQLRVLNTQQQIRLDELSVRNSILMTDLENSQATINILTRSRRANTITVPPLLPPPPAQRSRSPRIGYSNGAGENLGFIPQAPAQPTYRNLIRGPSRDSRRKVPRRLLVHNNESSDESPTDEILREARQRLRKLEEETELVDRSYQEFKQRHSQSIQENLNAMRDQSAQSHYMSMPEHIRPMFQPRNNREFYVSTVDNSYSRKYFPNHRLTDFQVPSTSKCAENYQPNFVDGNQDFPSGFQRKTVEETEENDYRSSVESSAVLQLQNLSISSIEISSDNTDLSANKSPEKDL